VWCVEEEELTFRKVMRDSFGRKGGDMVDFFQRIKSGVQRHFILSLFLALGLPLWALTPIQAHSGVIVKISPGVDVENYFRTHGYSSTHAEELVPGSGIFLLELEQKSTGLMGAQSLSPLNQSSEIVYVQQNHPMTLRAVPDDEGYPDQWSLNNIHREGADIGAQEAWEYDAGGVDALGHDIVIAVIDDGVDVSHVDLVDNLWVNSGEIPGNEIDDDQNGYVDDVHGWNTSSGTGQVGSGDHGTHVAGIIGARGDNGTHISGVNWRIKILPISVQDFSSANVLKAYGYVLRQKKLYLESGGERGANIVATNSSFGYDFADCSSDEFPAWNDIYDELGRVGVLSVAATINYGTDVDQEGDVPTGCTSDFLITVTNTT